MTSLGALRRGRPTFARMTSLGALRRGRQYPPLSHVRAIVPHGADHNKIQQPRCLRCAVERRTVEQVKQLAACGRRASVALIWSLIEFDARRLYLREGCPHSSPTARRYCTCQRIGVQPHRSRVAARRYPKALGALERGDVTLTTVRLLAPHLTPANHGKVLPSARHRSKHGIQELIASLNPRPATTTMIRRGALQPSTDKPSRTSGF